jgi:hypothetical protein
VYFTAESTRCAHRVRACAKKPRALLSGTLCSIAGLALSACASQPHAAPAGDNEVPPRPVWTTATAHCDPLAAQTRPIELGTIIAAGKDERGTLYVVDHAASASDERVFVSNGDTLYRKRQSGAGSTGSSDFFWQFDDDGTLERLVVQKQGDEVTGMALAPADERTFFAQLDDRAQKLTPVDAASTRGIDVRNLPGDVVVEFVADAADGSRIVVTRPMDDWTYDDFRVFYGTNGRLFERATSFSGALSYRAFDFIVDGATWRVVFASSLSAVAESAIDTGTASLPLTLVDPPVVSPDDSFECFVRS